VGDRVADSPSNKLVGVLNVSCVDEWTTGLVQTSLPIRTFAPELAGRRSRAWGGEGVGARREGCVRSCVHWRGIRMDERSTARRAGRGTVVGSIGSGQTRQGGPQGGLRDRNFMPLMVTVPVVAVLTSLGDTNETVGRGPARAHTHARSSRALSQSERQRGTDQGWHAGRTPASSSCRPS